MGVSKFPGITYFGASDSEFMANEPVELEWRVLNARRILLDGVLQIANTASVQLTQSQTFQLSAYNRKGRVESTVVLSLLIPLVIRFEVETPVIVEGVPMDIRFCVKHTLQWEVVAIYGYQSTEVRLSVAKGIVDEGRQPFDHHISVLLNGPCTLQLLTSNGQQQGSPVSIRVGIRHLAVRLFTKNLVVRKGAVERITWKAENARSIHLFPGNIDVLEVEYYDWRIEEDYDLAIEIRTTGDFGQQVSDFRTLYLARINEFYTTNNGDPLYPKFYLNWSSTGLSNLRIHPENIPVDESVTGYNIRSTSQHYIYTLIGQTFNYEEVSAVLTLYPVKMDNFQLVNGSAIIGQTATVSWQVNFAKRIQLRVSHDPIWRELNSQDLSHDFQVFESTSHVMIAVWGEANVYIDEIPIPRFSGPEIRNIVLPQICIQLGVRWMLLPLTGQANLYTSPLQRNPGITRVDLNLLELIRWLPAYMSSYSLVKIFKIKACSGYLLRNIVHACKNLYQNMLNKEISDKPSHPYDGQANQ